MTKRRTKKSTGPGASRYMKTRAAVRTALSMMVEEANRLPSCTTTFLFSSNWPTSPRMAVEYIDRCAHAIVAPTPVLKRCFLNHSNPALSHCRWRPAHRRLCAHVQRGQRRSDRAASSPIHIWLFHIADHGLPTVVYLHMLDTDKLLQNLYLGCISPH